MSNTTETAGNGVRRDASGRVVAGSGAINPGGRPKVVAEVIRLAREHTVEAIETLVDIMRDGAKEQARVAAANAILDRGWGKAPSVPIDEDEQAKAASSKLSPRDALAALLSDKPRGPDDSEN